MSISPSLVMDKQTFTTKLGIRIREVREGLGVSQSELARRCDKDRQHIEMIENGKVTCTSYNFYLICNGLGCSPTELFEFRDY